MPDLPPLTLASGLALLITIGCLWLSPRWPWIAAFAATVMASYVAGVMRGPAVLWLAMLAAALCGSFYRQRPWLRAIAVLAAVALTLLLGMHALPGFNNPLIVRDAVFSPDAAPFTLYFNFDKTLAGVLLLGVGSMLPVASPGWRIAVERAWPLILLNVLVAMPLSLAMGYVRFEPHWTSFFWTWATINLMLTCLSEEAFFRGFILREVRATLEGSRYAAVIAVSVGALLFGLAHFAGGWRYVLLATVAGAGYGIVYQRTQRIELAILAHFALNATHFLLFTYPYLRNG